MEKSSSSIDSPPVLILGAGIHGAAVARELLLNGLNVVLMDQADVASGATSKSSRLIHGGLRYLEYGDVSLVRESLAERRRNLELAACFVEPIRLFIPLEHSWSGMMNSAIGFFGGSRTFLRTWLRKSSAGRGFWPVRAGLVLYDWLAADEKLTASSGVSLSSPAAPAVNRERFRSMIAYTDAQMRYPERVVIALLHDAAKIASELNLSFRVHTYSSIRVEENLWSILSPDHLTTEVIQPLMVVNVSGAAGDATLRQVGIASTLLFGGTKGSHLITWNAELRNALKGQAVYAEAADGRPVFTLPFGEGVLIGTTDVEYSGDPAEATTSEAEIRYLCDMVRSVFRLELKPEDIVATCCGVRPLPHTDVTVEAAISRDHSLVWHETATLPVLTLVGGKLTTWRAVAEELADLVLRRVERPRHATTRQRMIPGGEFPPGGKDQVDSWIRNLAVQSQSELSEVRALWALFGTRTQEVLSEVGGEPQESVADSPLTRRVIRWIIRHEYVTSLADLVERRLMTIFQPELSRAHLLDLAQCLIDCGKLSRVNVGDAVDSTIVRLQRHYNRRF